MKTRSKTRKILTALLIGVLLFFSVLLLGVVLVTYMPGLNLNQWLQETANGWIAWRFFLYVVVIGLMYRIYRVRPFSVKLWGLVIAVFFTVEGLNFLYRL
ncbi:MULTISPECIES: hypothetical protein [unclassified Avibacterium]|uniref:hypothetical protein n=1 Tax=unclassified Avibacterium TaxID=2685287 RepID=UPI002026DB75|nr:MULTISPECIES: hypothetical protein [unclassified Avibacterium]MCW9716838.1 hypothetical protein [Avibacterium sp. 21-599]URL05892.1 hypothetical protein L4F92_07375 [Avibacterium sp. 21-595]